MNRQNEQTHLHRLNPRPSQCRLLLTQKSQLLRKLLTATPLTIGLLFFRVRRGANVKAWRPPSTRRPSYDETQENGKQTENGGQNIRLQNRNPRRRSLSLSIQGADRLGNITIVLLWACLLPIGPIATVLEGETAELHYKATVVLALIVEPSVE